MPHRASRFTLLDPHPRLPFHAPASVGPPPILRQSRNYCDFSALGRVLMGDMVVHHVELKGTPHLPPIYGRFLRIDWKNASVGPVDWL